MRFFNKKQLKKCEKICVCQKKVLSLHIIYSVRAHAYIYALADAGVRRMIRCGCEMAPEGEGME